MLFVKDRRQSCNPATTNTIGTGCSPITIQHDPGPLHTYILLHWMPSVCICHCVKQTMTSLYPTLLASPRSIRDQSRSQALSEETPGREPGVLCGHPWRSKSADVSYFDRVVFGCCRVPGWILSTVVLLPLDYRWVEFSKTSIVIARDDPGYG